MKPIKLKSLIKENVVAGQKIKEYKKLHNQFESQLHKYERSGFVSNVRNIKFEESDRHGYITTTIEFDYQYKSTTLNKINETEGRFYFVYGQKLKDGSISEYMMLTTKIFGEKEFKPPIKPKKVVDYLLFEQYEVLKNT